MGKVIVRDAVMGNAEEKGGEEQQEARANMK